MWRSDPQMALTVTRTRASSGPWIPGLGTSSTRTSRSPWKVTAFIPQPDSTGGLLNWAFTAADIVRIVIKALSLFRLRTGTRPGGSTGNARDALGGRRRGGGAVGRGLYRESDQQPSRTAFLPDQVPARGLLQRLPDPDPGAAGDVRQSAPRGRGRSQAHGRRLHDAARLPAQVGWTRTHA